MAGTRARRKFAAGRGRRVAAIAVGLCIALTGACAPATPDAASWRSDAARSLADGASSVRTAELALRVHHRGRMFHAYLQTVLVDAEEGVGSASQMVATTQPPTVERERYDRVTGELEDASGLVAAALVLGHSLAIQRARLRRVAPAQVGARTVEQLLRQSCRLGSGGRLPCRQRFGAFGLRDQGPPAQSDQRHGGEPDQRRPARGQSGREGL